ncbi:MAG: hypothetical protein Q7S27_00790 [Nanoarchaeota archaeon]|nr:hypothetical protein [Nanoarchaeota archaeon]
MEQENIGKDKIEHLKLRIEKLLSSINDYSKKLKGGDKYNDKEGKKEQES